jgi:hypothetical protein
MDPAGGELHCEPEIEGDEPALHPDIDGRGVDRAEHIPVGLEELLPGGSSLPPRYRLEAVFPGMLWTVVSHIPFGAEGTGIEERNRPIKSRNPAWIAQPQSTA